MGHLLRCLHHIEYATVRWYFLPLLTRRSGRRCSLRRPSAWWLSESLSMALLCFCVAVGLQTNSLFSCLWTAPTTSGWKSSRWVHILLCAFVQQWCEIPFFIQQVSIPNTVSINFHSFITVVLCCRRCWQSHQTVQCGWLPVMLTVALWEWSTAYGRSQVATEYGRTCPPPLPYTQVLHSTNIFIVYKMFHINKSQNSQHCATMYPIIHWNIRYFCYGFKSEGLVNVMFFVLCFLFSVASCAFVSNLKESSAAPNLQPAHKSMQSVLEGDLVMNVFRDGRWGVFRHQLITHGT